MAEEAGTTTYTASVPASLNLTWIILTSAEAFILSQAFPGSQAEVTVPWSSLKALGHCGGLCQGQLQDVGKLTRPQTPLAIGHCLNCRLQLLDPDSAIYRLASAIFLSSRDQNKTLHSPGFTPRAAILELFSKSQPFLNKATTPLKGTSSSLDRQTVIFIMDSQSQGFRSYPRLCFTLQGWSVQKVVVSACS